MRFTRSSAATRPSQTAVAAAAQHPTRAEKSARTPRLRLTKRQTLLLCSVVLILLAGWSLRQLYTDNSRREQPQYETILPANNTIDQLGGWQRISPPENDPVFAYADSIGDVAISVSQQPLPKAFAGNANNQLAELAKQYNATTKLEATGATIYVGTSAKGPQSALLTKNNLLIMIKSQKKVSDANWILYVNSMKADRTKADLF